MPTLRTESPWGERFGRDKLGAVSPVLRGEAETAAAVRVRGRCRRRLFRMLRHPDPLDFPLQLDSGGLAHAPAHLLAQALDIGGGRRAAVDEEVAVHLRDLRVAAR